MAFLTAARSSPSPSGASSSTIAPWSASSTPSSRPAAARRSRSASFTWSNAARVTGPDDTAFAATVGTTSTPGGDEDVEEPAHLGPGAAEPGHDLVSVEELGGAEVVEVRLLADEGVRLLHELPDRDPHRGQTLGSRHVTRVLRRPGKLQEVNV